MAVLLRGCTDCPYPIDEAALPRHPVHDLSAAQRAGAGRRYAEVLARVTAREAREARETKEVERPAALVGGGQR